MKRLKNNKLYLLLTLVLVAFAYLYTSLIAQTSSDRISIENYNDLPNSRRLVTKLNIKHIEENKVEVSWVGIYHPNLMYYVYRSEDPILSKTVLTNAKVVASTKATNASTTYTIYDNLPKYDKYYYAVISYIDNINFYTATENMDLMQFEYYDPFKNDMTNINNEINTNEIITNNIITNDIITNDLNTNNTYFTNDMLTNIVNSNDFLSYYPNTNLFDTNYSILPPTNYVDLYYTTNRIDSNRGIVFSTNYYNYTNYYNLTNNYTNYYNTTKIYIINPTNDSLTNEINTNDFVTNDFTNQSRMVENVTNELKVTSFTNDKNENIVNVEIKKDNTKKTPTEYQRYSSEYQRALAQFKANNYSGAIATLEPISRKKVDSALYYDINLLLGKSYKNAGRKKNALDTLKKIKSINPNEVNFWINQVLSDL
ncbi:M48 family metallopeptidase [Brachyspira pilosicoli]|uniref:tetratricopeptide repeat protein n=1 Tax=Brachyspira pilosicoli TaxID=52584 RepID=UPI001CA573CB|nr:tetratricopeptide repeat protein [Brachyspira pilosicoli]MBW5398087.1 tetratricopeptide repeat protein [Brachyspira pilosicoli]